MGLLEVLGFRKKENTLEAEINELKTTIEEHNNKGFDEIKNDVRTIFSELQTIKLGQKELENSKENINLRINKIGEKMMEIDNDLLKVAYKDELSLLKKEFDHYQEDIKQIKESQSQITDKFIDFALNKKEEEPPVVRTAEAETSELTEFEEDILSKYAKNITSEQISMDTGMSKGHISRTLKALHKKGYLDRKRKGKEFIYDSK